MGSESRAKNILKPYIKHKGVLSCPPSLWQLIGWVGSIHSSSGHNTEENNLFPCCVSNPSSSVSTTDMPYSECEQVVRQFRYQPPYSPVSTTDVPYSKCEQIVRQFKCLPPLELMVQSEARSAAHRLWSLGS